MTIPKPPSRCDTECYQNYWLCSFDTGEEFDFWPGKELDIAGLSAALRKYCVVTFNGQHYDMPLICLALHGASTEQLKEASDSIIVGGLKGWQVCRVFDWIDHIDLFDVMPGQASLKMYGGKMHSKRLQDLPIEPSALITPEQRQVLRDYCRNDLATTGDAHRAMSAQLALREAMSAEYGIDLRSKSDAQIAGAVMKVLLPFKVVCPYIPPGTRFTYRPPEWLQFQSLDLLQQLARMEFVINDKGSVSPPFAATFIDWGDNQIRMDPHGMWVKRPQGWITRQVRIGRTSYAVGIGGLHSMESKVCQVADADYELTDHDVRAYYPSLILATGIYPQQIGVDFIRIYREWYMRRNAPGGAKDRSEDASLSKAERVAAKKESNSLKTLLNAVFGHLGNMWSIFYAPSEMIQVTVGGQLMLLMLIEMLEACGIQCVSANTDGIVLRTHKSMVPLRNECIAWWERVTGFETEITRYKLLASRDVNSYVAITTDGKVKTKGAYAAPEPGPSGWPNPTGQIAVDAVVAYLQNGTPLADTVRACADIRQFLHVRQVKGGGSYCPDGVLPKAPTQLFMRSIVGDIKDKAELLGTYGHACAQEAARREYLGKAVRWYYAKGSKGCIVTPTGGMVARSEGCRPLMTLPDVPPPDIDYDWYITEARSLLADLGVT
jgi:hypothetical protein